MAGEVNLHITVEKLAEFRLALERKQEELRERLSAERAAEAVQRPEGPLDSGDWCQKIHEEWLFLNYNRLEMALLRDVQAALQRLEEGCYGQCQECEQPISSKRLDAVPWAPFCAACQERYSELSSRD
jgi:DnaK suppressor protein